MKQTKRDIELMQMFTNTEEAISIFSDKVAAQGMIVNDRDFDHLKRLKVYRTDLLKEMGKEVAKVISAAKCRTDINA